MAYLAFLVAFIKQRKRSLEYLARLKLASPLCFKLFWLKHEKDYEWSNLNCIFDSGVKKAPNFV